MEFLTQVGVVLACIVGIFIIIGFLDELTCHSYNIVSRLVSTLFNITSELAPVMLVVLAAYPIVLLIFWLITTYTNINITITF